YDPNYQTYGEDKKRKEEMANYSPCKLGRAEERLLSMFVHEAFNNRLLRRMRATARSDEDALLQHFHRIPVVQHALHHYRTINTGHAIVRLSYFLQYRRRFFSGIGIERDHHAAGIALQNRDDHLRADPQGSADEFILGEASGGRQVHIDVCPETALIHRHARLVGQLPRRLQTKDRHGTAIG